MRQKFGREVHEMGSFFVLIRCLRRRFSAASACGTAQKHVVGVSLHDGFAASVALFVANAESAPVTAVAFNVC